MGKLWDCLYLDSQGGEDAGEVQHRRTRQWIHARHEEGKYYLDPTCWSGTSHLKSFDSLLTSVDIRYHRCTIDHRTTIHGQESCPIRPFRQKATD
jgi:hypothetical protein